MILNYPKNFVMVTAKEKNQVNPQALQTTCAPLSVEPFTRTPSSATAAMGGYICLLYIEIFKTQNTRIFNYWAFYNS